MYLLERKKSSLFFVHVCMYTYTILTDLLLHIISCSGVIQYSTTCFSSSSTTTSATSTNSQSALLLRGRVDVCVYLIHLCARVYCYYYAFYLSILPIKYLVYLLWHCVGNTFPHRFIPVFHILGYRWLYHMQCLTKVRVADGI